MNLSSLPGVFALLGLCWLLSNNRSAIRWRLVALGMGAQMVLALVFLSWDYGNKRLRMLGDEVEQFLGLSKAGSEFVFGALARYGDVEQAFPGDGVGFIFATQVLPTLIFFSSFMAVLYHLGLMQRVVAVMAVVMRRLLGISGAESLSACGNVFVGQTEAPLLVRPFLGAMTQSELHTVMVGGFCTIAGGVFALYIGMGVEAGHLMVASVMAVPAGLVVSKLLVPETGTPETLGVGVQSEKSGYGNTVEAAAGGAGDGLKLALNVGAMLIAFLGLVAVMDWLLASVCGWFSEVSADQPPALSVKSILGWLFWPIAFVMGVSGEDVTPMAQLLGTKIAVTELIAYGDLGAMKDQLQPRTYMMASFALCGFANFGSVAIQIGGLGAMAPERRGDVAKLALRAMVGGAIATCMTACIAGIFYSQGAG